MINNDQEWLSGESGDIDPTPPQPGEPYLIALGRRRASRQRKIFADQHFYAISEVAERLKVKDELIRELIRRGELHAFRIGKAYRITDDDIDEYLQSCSTKRENFRDV